ncbi:hypothetical protein R1flu_007603 [Riccia fluitans]|uniref:Uncharacterized protein n=1 Tax=Riccia fluitans TaxID=41844 RepID=A0ABD1YZC1_9MARC
MTDLGKVSHFLGIHVDYNLETGTLKLSQKAYILLKLARFNLSTAASKETPMKEKEQVHYSCSITESGERLTEKRAIIREVYEFYELTFSSPSNPQDPDHGRGEVDQFLSVLKGKADQGLVAFMDDEPTYEEFTEILLYSARERSPGLDGFNADAFRKLWDFLGRGYVQAMIFCWRTTTFPKGFMEGVISLISKESGAESLRAWRPITLLSMVYKLFAKVEVAANTGSLGRITSGNVRVSSVSAFADYTGRASVGYGSGDQQWSFTLEAWEFG